MVAALAVSLPLPTEDRSSIATILAAQSDGVHPKGLRVDKNSSKSSQSRWENLLSNIRSLLKIFSISNWSVCFIRRGLVPFVWNSIKVTPYTTALGSPTPVMLISMLNGIFFRSFANQTRSGGTQVVFQRILTDPRPTMGSTTSVSVVLTSGNFSIFCLQAFIDSIYLFLPCTRHNGLKSMTLSLRVSESLRNTPPVPTARFSLAKRTSSVSMILGCCSIRPCALSACTVTIVARRCEESEDRENEEAFKLFMTGGFTASSREKSPSRPLPAIPPRLGSARMPSLPARSCVPPRAMVPSDTGCNNAAIRKDNAVAARDREMGCLRASGWREWVRGGEGISGCRCTSGERL
mmetsp:Transcript_756/g.1121  ORF Transcript_756/g.1121 Transcript_756/m.1121 type:complete len:350 (+) Transcript_756:644-1693(+)